MVVCVSTACRGVCCGHSTERMTPNPKAGSRVKPADATCRARRAGLGHDGASGQSGGSGAAAARGSNWGRGSLARQAAAGRVLLRTVPCLPWADSGLTVYGRPHTPGGLVQARGRHLCPQPHFTCEETEAHRNQVASPRSHLARGQGPAPPKALIASDACADISNESG